MQANIQCKLSRRPFTLYDSDPNTMTPGDLFFVRLTIGFCFCMEFAINSKYFKKIMIKTFGVQQFDFKQYPSLKIFA